MKKYVGRFIIGVFDLIQLTAAILIANRFLEWLEFSSHEKIGKLFMHMDDE